MRPFFSVIVPCYNSGIYLRDAIESIRCQTFKDYEIILVNDGSTDQTTLEIIETLEKSITVIHQTNQGQGFARNQAIERAQGEFLAFLDSDDLWQPFALDYLYTAITQCAAQLCFSEVSQFMIEEDPKIVSSTSPFLQPEYRSFNHFNEFYNASSMNVYLPGAFCVKKDILGFTVRYLEERVNGEDLHFILQLTHAVNIAWIEHPTILAYRSHASNSTNDYHKGVLGIKALYRHRSKGFYDNPLQRSMVVSNILSSHARSISVLMLRQRRLADALQLYHLAMIDNLILVRFRYLLGFWFEMLISLFRVL